MLKKHVVGVFFLGLTICLASVSANAQVGKFTVFGGYSYLSNSWGNGCLSACAGGAPTQLHGYSAAVAYSFNNHLGLEANFAGHNGSPTDTTTPAITGTNGSAEIEHQDLYTLTFGPMLTLPVGDFSMFTHFLVGPARGHEGFIDKCLQGAGASPCFAASTTSSHGNGFAYQTGGGVDWNHGRWGIRVLEVDYVHPSIYVTETCGTCTQKTLFGISANNFQLATGVTWNFGMK